MARYAVADLHGRYDLFEMIRDYLQPEDTLYVLGDCGDRGPDGWKIIKEVYDHPQMIYIKGNHEDMLVNAMIHDYDIQLCFMNGGRPTYEAWQQEATEEKAFWRKALMDLADSYAFQNDQGQSVMLCHAGCSPDNADDLIWNRDHIGEEWPENYDNMIIVHGHTPIELMCKYLWGIERKRDHSRKAMWYCPDINGNYHKVNIDNGAVWTGAAILLNLDTWEEHLFVGEELGF